MSDYIMELRKVVGHAPIMCTACGVIIENESRQLLLQHRLDNDKWGLPGGGMNIGETFAEAARREVYEETGLIVGDLQLFGIFSGKDRVIQYPNGDICCATSIIFKTKSYEGILLQATDETRENVFFGAADIPSNINEFDRKYINLWLNGTYGVVVD